MNEDDLKAKWKACNPSVTASDYMRSVRRIQGTLEFIALLYQDNHAGDNSKPIATLGSLKIFSRARIRAPYHVTLRSIDEPTPRPGKVFSSWNWQLSPEMLEDAIEFACCTDFVVTLSTVKSGAGTPLSVHLQGVPKVVEWQNEQYHLFRSLLASKNTSSLRQGTPKISIQDYPIFVAKVAGPRAAVCEKVLALSLGYDSLRSYNLIVSRPLEDETEGDLEVVAFFVPRRLDGLVIPETSGPLHSALGSWEMGGVFLTKEEGAFRQLNFENIVNMLSEVSIGRGAQEERLIKNLLRNL